jgi:hypothetical protein
VRFHSWYLHELHHLWFDTMKHAALKFFDEQFKLVPSTFCTECREHTCVSGSSVLDAFNEAALYEVTVFINYPGPGSLLDDILQNEGRPKSPANAFLVYFVVAPLHCCTLQLAVDVPFVDAYLL